MPVEVRGGGREGASPGDQGLCLLSRSLGFLFMFRPLRCSTPFEFGAVHSTVQRPFPFSMIGLKGMASHKNEAGSRTYSCWRLGNDDDDLFCSRKFVLTRNSATAFACCTETFALQQRNFANATSGRAPECPYVLNSQSSTPPCVGACSRCPAGHWSPVLMYIVWMERDGGH